MPFLLPVVQETIHIDAFRWVAIQADRSVAYEGEVVVTYGKTKLLADRVVLYDGEQRGIAEGHVVMVDPDGTVHADRMEFNWNPIHRFGSAERVMVEVAGATFKARRATFEPGEWTLYDAEGTTAKFPTPLYYVTSEKVVVRPDQLLIVSEPRISLLGHFIAQIPTERISLSTAVPGIHLPVPTYRVGRGAGITWGGGIEAGHNGVFTFTAAAIQQRKPSGLAIYTHSFLPLAKASQIISPKTDFAERFSYGYLDSVRNATPDSEYKYLRAPRSSISFGTQLNGGISDRDRGTRYTKVESVFERGSEVHGFGFLGQIRAQEIKREEGDFHPRVNFMGSLGLPSIKLTPQISTLARLDSQSFVGRTTFGWARAMAGLTYAPTSWLRLSGGGFLSGQAGDPEYAMDPLYSKGGALMRADFTFGGLRVSYLAKDDGRRGFYDREYSINQVIGCLEASYIVREHPRNHQLALMLRVEPLREVFRRRGLSHQPAPSNQKP